MGVSWEVRLGREEEGMDWMVAGVNSSEDSFSSGLLPSTHPMLTASWEMKRDQKPMSCKYV